MGNSSNSPEKQPYLGRGDHGKCSYLERDPIFDLSLKVRGPAADSAHKFANAMWDFIRRNNKHGDDLWHTFSNSFTAEPFEYGQEAAPPLTIATIPGTGKVPVLGVAVPGWNLAPTDAININSSERALVYYIQNAERSIYLSQQDLIKGLHRVAKPEVANALVQFLVDKKGLLGIVLSTKGAKATDGDSYSMDHDLHVMLEKLEFEVKARFPSKPNTDIRTLLQRQVLLATIRFNHRDEAWPDGTPFGNHAKFWMVDERVFYVGSDNVYPLPGPIAGTSGSLQEYGFVIDHAASAADVVKEYWRPMLEFSTSTSISGMQWGVPPERFLPSSWRRTIEVPPARRMGQLQYHRSETLPRAWLLTLSGTGELLVRIQDGPGGNWRITEVVDHPGSPITVVGPCSTVTLIAV